MSDVFCYDWATIVCQLLRGAPDGKTYAITAAYIEFENNGGAAVSPPTPARNEGRSYYDSLLSDPNRDYLRVPVAATTLDTTDETLFPGGNKLKVYAQTAGTVGVHGKPFNSTAQSRIYGGALVATPDWDDPTQDLVLCRWYYDADAQLIKLAGSQVFVSREVTLN